VRFIIDNRINLSRAPAGPLAKYIVPFERVMREQGYARYSLYRQAMLAARFSEWLRQRDVALRGITSDHPQQYLRYRARRVRPSRGDGAALRHLLNYLRRERVIPTAKKLSACLLTPSELCAQAYEQHLREARGLARATIINYVPFVRSFLKDRFGDGPATLAHLCARDVVAFVQRQASHLHPKRAKLLTSALRSFLHYARYRGEVKLDLAAAVPIVPKWSMSSVPRAIGADQVRQLLASIERNTALGRRDYAILLLLSRLGLRSSEVAFLELDGIDWKAGRLSVRGKGGQRSEFPLPSEVGKAIAAYLRNGRPRCGSRRVFLRARAPICGFQGACGVGSIVRHRLLRAGVESPTYGTHQFRHGLATEMLRHGASLGEIGELLGHHNPQTTKIYTKVDLEALRTLALPWPGGVR
jgi:site-specific recombinase XerD